MRNNKTSTITSNNPELQLNKRTTSSNRVGSGRLIRSVSRERTQQQQQQQWVTSLTRLRCTMRRKQFAPPTHLPSRAHTSAHIATYCRVGDVLSRCDDVISGWSSRGRRRWRLQRRGRRCSTSRPTRECIEERRAATLIKPTLLVFLCKSSTMHSFVSTSSTLRTQPPWSAIHCAIFSVTTKRHTKPTILEKKPRMPRSSTEMASR